MITVLCTDFSGTSWKKQVIFCSENILSNKINSRRPVSHDHTCKTRSWHGRSLARRTASEIVDYRCSSDRINVHDVMDVADGNVLSRRGSSTPPATAGKLTGAHFAEIYAVILTHW